MQGIKVIAVVIATLLLGICQAQTSCPNIPPARYPYELAAGWSSIKVVDGLTRPRDIVVDAKGRLLMVESGKGVTQHTVDANGCITSSRVVVATPDLNHGIYLSPDGLTLYASSASYVYRWPYDPGVGSDSDDAAAVTVWSPEPLVSGMATSGHISRTLIVPPDHPNLLVVSHGSNANIDNDAFNPATGRAIVKVFDLARVPDGGYNYTADGWNAGYGLRNEVGLAFDGNGMLWGVENSADDLHRATANDTATVDIHEDNPAEELNYLGDVTRPSGAWYGYPSCFTVWNPSSIPPSSSYPQNLTVGSPFMPNSPTSDLACLGLSVAPRLSLPPHTAPLDAKFDAGFATLFVSLHGSWDRRSPAGYKVVGIPFTTTRNAAGNAGSTLYEPVAAADSPTGWYDVWFPPDETACSEESCARPVGLVFDRAGRLYVTCDASGEVFLLMPPPAAA
ncbi:soluble quino protein glucose/sorbosone dehydrogenase [Xylariomycetidae sp. FL2044]|nr:soluble quino protein glucose/sorbosone dehydrogenase [Xylariomycetidae sp. FL2044]